MSKLWSKGQSLDALIEEYTVGDDPRLDRRLLEHDVRASQAHARMLQSIGILDEAECGRLIDGLDAVATAFEAGTFTIEQADEDVHTAIERFLVEELGDLGKKIHTGRSRNDQVLVALALWQRQAVDDAREALTMLAQVFDDFAAAHGEVPLPGYTHLQRAMPSTVGRWAAAWSAQLRANTALLDAAAHLVRLSPLGSAAGYGVPETLGNNREQTAAELGFDGPQEPAEAVQIGRGKPEAALVFAMANIARDLGRWAWDVCLYVTTEFGFFSLPEAFTTGSSIMPQKRNPDVLELTRARVAVVQAALHEVLSISSPLPSGYHRDLQLLKAPTFRGYDTTMQMIAVVAHVMGGLTVNSERCAAAMSEELFATEEAYRLVKDGVPFRDAYRQVGARYSDSDES
ncbi:MAG: argininosuccinate lyase [Myxococcota bacterium]|nr:argininosuccinate lyase [Myxococcota bacterium]